MNSDRSHSISNEELIQDDVLLILRALGLGDHARPYSCHKVIIDEVLPAIEKIRIQKLEGQQVFARGIIIGAVGLKDESHTLETNKILIRELFNSGEKCLLKLYEDRKLMKGNRIKMLLEVLK